MLYDDALDGLDDGFGDDPIRDKDKEASMGKDGTYSMVNLEGRWQWLTNGFEMDVSNEETWTFNANDVVTHIRPLLKHVSVSPLPLVRVMISEKLRLLKGAQMKLWKIYWASLVMILSGLWVYV